LGDQKKENEMGWHRACMGRKVNVYRVLFGKPEGKRPLRRPRRKGNIILQYIISVGRDSVVGIATRH
jgi:hypothetical protein